MVIFLFLERNGNTVVNQPKYRYNEEKRGDFMGDVFRDGLTEISARQFEFVTRDNLTPREAVAFLRSGMQLRTFRDILMLVCGSEDREKELIQGLLNQDQTQQPDSVRKKVRNWISGKSVPTEREDVFRICFALKLDIAASERMLILLTQQGIHYRNIREMIYAYCLRYGMDYRYACSLAQQLERGKEPGNTKKEPVTHILRQEFQSVKAEEDLFSFILRNKENLGTTHNTAYSYFCKMLELLTGENLEGEGQYSMEYVADTYLRLNVPNEKNTSRYSDIQKMVKRYWPGPRSIKAMKSRGEDVNRKTLLLLYLVTGGVWDGEYDELDEDYIQPREYMEGHCRRMNEMLTQCGMGTIDPRNVFDYLVLFCLRPEDDQFMSDRMAALAAEIFQ